MPPAENPRFADFQTLINNNTMDFSRNGQGGFNDQEDMNQVSDQELMQRLAASRASAGIQMPQMSQMSQDTFGLGPRGFGGQSGTNAMFGQSVGPTPFPPNASGGTGNAGGLSMMHQAEEDELLFQLLLARRRRAEIQQQGPGSDRNSGASFSDELLRLRQAGNAAAASSATTAAIFGSDQGQQLLHQQGSMRGNTMFQTSNTANFMMQDGSGVAASGAGPNDQLRGGGLNNGGMNMGGLGARRFDDYLLRTQQQHPQESVMAGFSNDQQRIEISPSRFLSLHKQGQGPGFMDIGMPQNKRNFDGNVLPTLGNGELEKMEPPAKKKRFHKKKPADMPRRPLSAYNLFFSEERERILKEIDDKEGGNNNSKKEEKTPNEESKEGKKPNALLRPLLPSEKKRRPHRKTHGKISFRLLAQMVGQRWKALPDDKRKYYQDLAKEDMARQKKAMEEYYLKQAEKVKKLETKDKQSEDEEKLDGLQTNVDSN